MKRRTPTAVESRSEMLQLRATLNYIEPPIWRRLLVPRSATFAGLHGVLQTAIGWTDSHLHRFSHGRAEMRDKMAIGEAFAKKNDTVLYEYDFGDSWEVRLVLEAVVPAGEVKGAGCIDGARAGPLDDSGGVPGYENLIEALADPKHPDHHDLGEWTGGNYDPEAFDREAINRTLASLRRLR